MNILVPLNNIEFLKDYINAGAGEFYMGFYDEEWNKNFGNYSDINRMSGYGKRANCLSIDEIPKVINLVKENDADIFITFNSASYSDDELEFIRKYFKIISGTKANGIILSNPDVMSIAKEEGLPIVISTIAGAYNSDIVQFYKKEGAKRIILPRDLSMEEIDTIINIDKNMEYEVFIMRNGCKFSDSNCLGFHRTEMCSICADLDNCNNEINIFDDNFKSRSSMECTDNLLRDEFHYFSCGMCAIYDFIRMNINAGKVVGRSDECSSICEDIKLIRKNIEIASQCNSREEYLDKMIFPENRSIMCTNGMSCYYPEIRF